MDIRLSGNNCVQITCNSKHIRQLYVQHVLCQVVQRDSSAVKVDRVEIAFDLTLFHWLKQLTNEGGKETRVSGEDT